MQDTDFEIGGKKFRSRLIVGTGKYRDFAETKAAVEESGAEIVTVAVRRVNITDRGKENLLDYLDPKRYQILPNTAGCSTAEEAIRTCRLSREVGVGDFVKLEVIGDNKTLFPDVAATIEAARVLVKEGFKVMPYVTDDPVTCLRLQEIGGADWLGPGNSQPIQYRDHYRAGEGAGDRRCGRRHGVGRGGGDGAWVRRRADEYGDRGGEGSDRDGAGDAAGD
jgi:thiazole synthase ThiGH ThiG subunit